MKLSSIIYNSVYACIIGHALFRIYKKITGNRICPGGKNRIPGMVPGKRRVGKYMFDTEHDRWVVFLYNKLIGSIFMGDVNQCFVALRKNRAAHPVLYAISMVPMEDKHLFNQVHNLNDVLADCHPAELEWMKGFLRNNSIGFYDKKK